MKRKNTKTMSFFCIFQILLFVLLLCLVTVDTTFATQIESSEVESSETESSTAESKPEETQFDVEIEYGLKGIINYLSDIPISVSVSNLEENFEGILRITSQMVTQNSQIIIPQEEDENKDAIVAYEYDLLLSKGEAKTFEVAMEYDSLKNYDIKIEIFDLSENLRFSENLTVDTSGTNLGVIGVLSNEYPSLTYFYGVQISMSNEVLYSSIFELTKDDMPTSSNVLSCVNMLIIDGFDTSQLSRQQCLAIQEWVYQGGILIIGTGPDAVSTLSMFQDENKFSSDFLKVDINGVIEGDLTVLSAQNDGYDGIVSFTKEDGVPLISIEGASIINRNNVLTSNISYDDELALVQKKEVGDGAIFVTSFSLCLDPIGSLEWNEYLGKAILNDAKTSYFENALNLMDINEEKEKNINYQMYELLEKLFDVKIPNIIMYIAFFVIYVLLAGPLGYILLKLNDKREWIWGLIPAGTILFTIFIAVLSLPSRITDPIISDFTVLELQENLINKKMYVAIRTPDIKKYTIHLKSDYSDFNQLSSNSGNIKLNQNYIWDYALKKTTEGYQITTNHGQTFATDYMMFEDTRVRNDCSLDVLVTKATASYFIGSVTNNTGYDMTDVFICYGSTTVYLGDMADGVRKKFDIKDNLYLPQFSSKNLSNYLQADESIQPQIENAYRYVVAVNSQKLARNQCVVFGYVKDLGQQLISDENDENIKETGAGLIYKEFKIPTQQVEGTYIKDIYKKVVKKDYKEIAYNNNMMKVPVAEMELELPITTIQTIYKKQPPYGGDCTDVIVWAYNYETKVYDKLFTNNSDEMTFTNSCPYIDENGKMLLRFECTDFEEGQDFIPGIALIGE